MDRGVRERHWMSTEFCSECHRPLPRSVRRGVALTELKARIFDLIKRSDGITNEDINMIVFDGRAKRSTIKAHIWQINEALTNANVCIRSFGGGGPVSGFYYVGRKGTR